jgi:hypothetical protein
MNNKELVHIIATMFGVAVIALSALVAPTSATNWPAYYKDNPPTAAVVSPPYGYFTHQPANTSPEDSDRKFDSLAALRWGTTSVNYVINSAGCCSAPGSIPEATARQRVQDAENNWFSTLSASSALPSLNYQSSPTGNVASLFTECGGTGGGNSVNEIDFCPIGPAGLVKHSIARTQGLIVTTTESDMALADNEVWDTNSIYTTALHEFGHTYGLGDMEYSYVCATYETTRPVMCGNFVSTLTWGDKDGIRWLYPKLTSFALSPSGTISGADSAMDNIDTSTVNDILFVWGDYSSGTGQTTIKAKVVWDISTSTGIGGTVGTTVTLLTVSGQTSDIGAALDDIAGLTTKRDLVITWGFQTGSSNVNYKTFRDITRSSNSFTWPGGETGTLTFTGVSGHRGNDVTLFNMNGAGAKEMVIATSFNPGTGLKLYYHYGILGSDGSASFWTAGGSSGTIGLVNEDVGISVPFHSSRIATVNNQDSLGKMREHVLHFTTSSSIDASITSKHALGRQPTGIATGLGAGDAVNFGEQSSYSEQIFCWTDSSNAYYMVDWDSRLNSHV